ncbi:Protein unc-119 -like protein [Triplophysa tibetana]|uniref:Protein unc-119-like protein n=1 Tax=Triplophysa tibetana TaxID=1572043 RepID=A0A5A9N8K2_9TELE|nr:Protein unc-119 -like protein [Triplophysa tibetana]
MSSDPEGESEQEKEDDEIKEDETVRQGEREGGEMRDVEDWNGFLAARGEHAAPEEVMLDWKPGDPVTPQYVLRLPGYTEEIEDVIELDAVRFIQYHFPPAFLNLKEIGATLEFTVGTKAVNKFRLIERHYFRDLLVKTFCNPHSRNTCEHIYSLPDQDSHTVEEMITNHFETRSDSYYFANNTLILHHKAIYSFSQGLELFENQT